MIFRTHIAFAFLLGLLFYNYFEINFIWILIGAGVPDIDEPKSKFGSKLKVLSKLIKFAFKHRGIFHSIFFGIFLSYIIMIFFDKISAIGVLIGFLSHLILDGLTIEGINFIYPFKQMRWSGFIRTGSKLESIIYYIILVIDALSLVKFLS